MREVPFLFTGEMVLALLAGRKTQTRRLITPANSLVDGSTPHREVWKSLDAKGAYVDPGPSPAGNEGPYLQVPRPSRKTVHRVYPRYGRGDRIWVRETLREVSGGWFYDADRSPVWLPVDDPRAAAMISWAHHWEHDKCVSIFMPRWASRIMLGLSEVRPERLHDLSEEDALREGVPAVDDVTFTGYDPKTDGYPTFLVEPGPKSGIQHVRRHERRISARESYAALWEEINAKRARWADNDWVWVYSFEVLSIRRFDWTADGVRATEGEAKRP